MANQDNQVDTLNQLDRDCVGELLKFGREHFGDAWKPVQVYEEDLGGEASQLQLFLPWAVYMYRVDGSDTALDRYLATQADALTPQTRSWFEAQGRAYVSIYEVLDTKPGVGINVRCRLTNTEHFVHEPRASLSLSPGYALCARVVTLDGTSVFCGVHHVAITADMARDMAQEVVTALGLDAPPAPTAMLCQDEATEEVFLAWEAAVMEAERDAELTSEQSA